VTDTLIRTASGLTNQHVFFGVDFVAYVEGGGNYASAMEAVNAGQDDTHDAEFWRTILEVASPEVTFHVKSVGSRRTAEEIALAIAKSGTNSAFVCTDSDADCLLPKAGPVAPTIQTWGYSWENDVACWEVAGKVFTDLHGRSGKAQAALQKFQAWYNNHLEEYRTYIINDIKQIRFGLPAVFDRETPTRPLGPTLTTCPKLDCDHLNSRVIHDDRLNLIQINPGNVSGLRHSFGKTLLKAVFHAFAAFGQTVKRARITYDYFLSLCISSLRNTLALRPEVLNYYSDAVRLRTCG